MNGRIDNPANGGTRGENDRQIPTYVAYYLLFTDWLIAHMHAALTAYQTHIHMKRKSILFVIYLFGGHDHSNAASQCLLFMHVCTYLSTHLVCSLQASWLISPYNIYTTATHLLAHSPTSIRSCSSLFGIDIRDHSSARLIYLGLAAHKAHATQIHAPSAVANTCFTQ